MTESLPRTALVVGATGGIGRVVARELGRRGYRLALAARRREGLDAVQAEFRTAGWAAEVFVGDITREDDVRRMVDAAASRCGGIDVLINAAGTARGEFLLRAKTATWTEMLETNLVGAARLSAAVVPGMRRQGSGHIIHVGSAAGIDGQRAFAAYSAAKAGLRAMAASLRKEVEGYGIKISIVAPARVDTPLQPVPAAERERLIRPEDVARAILFLLDLSGQATVHELIIEAADQVVDGGGPPSP